MSVARGFGLNGKSMYMNIAKPCFVNLNFTVDSTNGNGFGVRSLKSNGYVESVYMNTSAAITGTVATSAAQITSIAQGTSSLVVGMPVQGTGIPTGTTITSIISSSAVGISATPTGNHSSESITYQAVGSPNPLAGFVQVKFKNNFNYYLGGYSGFVSPVSGSAVKIDNSALTIGQAYIITTVGNSTMAQWQSIGVNPYMVSSGATPFAIGTAPTVGTPFIATAVGIAGEANVSTSRVMAPGVSGVFSIEAVGDTTQNIANSLISSNAGAIWIGQILAPTVSGSAYDTPMIPTAPANNTVIGMTFVFDGSSVTVDGL